MKIELELNDMEIDLLLEAISDINKKKMRIARENDLILHNASLSKQKTDDQLKQLADETKDLYLGLVLLKRIANKIKPDTYHEDETKL